MLNQTRLNAANRAIPSSQATKYRLGNQWIGSLVAGFCLVFLPIQGQTVQLGESNRLETAMCQGCHSVPTPSSFRNSRERGGTSEFAPAVFKELRDFEELRGQHAFSKEIDDHGGLIKHLGALWVDSQRETLEAKSDTSCVDIGQITISNTHVTIVSLSNESTEDTNQLSNPEDKFQVRATDEFERRLDQNPESSADQPHLMLQSQLLDPNTDTEPRNWEQIKSHGKLRMITMNRPTTFYLWRGEFAGFEYDLVSMFAQSRGLELDVLVVDGIDEAASQLERGRGDLIAASLTPTSKRRKMGLAFSHSYLPVEEVIVSREHPITRPEALAGRTVHVNPATSFFENLLGLQSSIDFSIVTHEEMSTERLVEEVAEGSMDSTVVDTHMFAAIAAVDDRIEQGLSIGRDRGLAWAVRSDQPMLLQHLNEWIENHYRGLEYNLARKRYFETRERMVQLLEHRIVGEVLSPFDGTTKTVAERYEFDWRLITSQMYQESLFEPTALSHAGAIGLLQVLPSTAKDLAVEPSRLLHPDVAIETGVRYLHWIRKQFQEFSPSEQHWFALAAYNAGIGHVKDARKLAAQLGLDNNKWFGNVEEAMLKLSRPEHYRNAQYGYVRGKETVEYVKSIRSRYQIYLAHFDQLASI